MKFKEEIKDKSQIRQILGDVSDSVIEQFERWWDKYGISLFEIERLELFFEKVLKQGVSTEIQSIPLFLGRVKSKFRNFT